MRVWEDLDETYPNTYVIFWCVVSYFGISSRRVLASLIFHTSGMRGFTSDCAKKSGNPFRVACETSVDPKERKKRGPVIVCSTDHDKQIHHSINGAIRATGSRAATQPHSGSVAAAVACTQCREYSRSPLPELLFWAACRVLPSSCSCWVAEAHHSVPEL